jgi:DNA topoisomerase-3
MTGIRTYIAEKPSLGKAIANYLAKQSPIVDRSRAYVAGKDWRVCWTVGHMFENAEPEFYIGSKFPDAPKSSKTHKYLWSKDHLPIQPGRNGWPGWKVSLDKTKKDLHAAIKRFVAESDIVVNAGDIDREGQRLIDEVFEELNYKKPIRRVLCSAIDDATIAKAMKDERDNAGFRNMSMAALARNHADWYVGMNFSRALTLTAQESGSRSVLPYGRVQTPLLGLIVERDLEIENFKPVDYFGITAQFKAQGRTFKAKWKPHEGQAGLDDEGRLLDKAIAAQLQALVSGRQGKVTKYSDTEKGEGPPLPFSIDKIRVLGIRRYGLTADSVTEIVQALYDAGYVTYPRSDCAYLPTSQHEEAPRVLSVVKSNLGLQQELASLLDSSRKSRAWNDAKVTAHHGIIPTGERVDFSRLTSDQAAIYRDIALRYAAQFMPDRRYRAVSVQIDVQGQLFEASGTTTISPGWKALYGETAADPEPDQEDGSAKADETEGVVLPPMKQDDEALCQGLNVESKKTTPPSHFTEDTLLEVMGSVHKYVKDEKIKAIFKKMFDAKKDGDEGACGLGTAATRQTFVPKLVDASFVTKKKGQKKAVYIISTPTARAYIQALPRDLSAPDMTALWETALSEIESGRNTYERFMEQLIAWVDVKLAEISSRGLSVPDSAATIKKFGPSTGAPRAPAQKADKDCPECGKPMFFRQGNTGPFLGCSGYPKCKHTEKVSGAA